MEDPAKTMIEPESSAPSNDDQQQTIDPQIAPTEPTTENEPPAEASAPPEASRNATMRMHEARWELIVEKFSANYIGLRNSLFEMRNVTDTREWQILHMKMKQAYADEMYNLSGILLGLFDDQVREKMSGVRIEREMPPSLITNSKG